MKYLLLIVSFFSVTLLSAQQNSPVSKPDPNKKIKVVEASCGECQFKMTGKGCHLAVRMDDKSWFVEGTSIDEHGDAHGEDGFCETVRKAEVQGEVVKDKFVVTYFKLLPSKKE